MKYGSSLVLITINQWIGDCGMWKVLVVAEEEEEEEDDDDASTRIFHDHRRAVRRVGRHDSAQPRR